MKMSIDTLIQNLEDSSRPSGHQQRHGGLSKQVMTNSPFLITQLCLLFALGYNAERQMPRSSLFTPLRALTLTALAPAISFVSGCSKRSPPDLSGSAGTNLPLLVLKGHTRDVNRIAFSPDGKHIATASLDHSVKLWNAGTGREMVTFTGHLNKVWPVAFSPDGTRVASAGSDMAVRVWDAASAREVLRFNATAGIWFARTR